MLESLQAYQLDSLQWGIALLSAVMVGFAKTGVSGAGILVVVLMAHIHGGKSSVGLVLPMLCMADLFAVRYYHRHAEWKYIWKPLPWAIGGVVLATAVGSSIPDELFRPLIGGLVLIMLAWMFLRDHFGQAGPGAHGRWFPPVIGIIGGFATMIGNAAGPVWAIYLLTMRLPKHAYIGTGAWFFLILNFIKIPFHVFWQKTITWESFSYDLAMLPAIALGAVLGILAVKRINEKVFRLAVHVLAMGAALKLLLA